MEKRYTFDEFLDIIKTLSGDNGCPWDRVQTHQSIKDQTLDEAYEVVEAINNNDMNNLCEELGDLLFHIVFHSQLSEKEGDFNIYDVITGISNKMISRHPHVFSETKLKRDWNDLKKEEKGYKSNTDILKHIPKSLPALIRADKVQKEAKDVGFDFDNISDAYQKVYEELKEFEVELKVGNKSNMETEFGDILFALVNISRFLDINAEFALTNSIEKFINRFEHIENTASQRGLSFSDMTLDQMDELWEEAKKCLTKKVKDK